MKLPSRSCRARSDKAPRIRRGLARIRRRSLSRDEYAARQEDGGSSFTMLAFGDYLR